MNRLELRKIVLIMPCVLLVSQTSADGKANLLLQGLF